MNSKVFPLASNSFSSSVGIGVINPTKWTESHNMWVFQLKLVQEGQHLPGGVTGSAHSGSLHNTLLQSGQGPGGPTSPSGPSGWARTWEMQMDRKTPATIISDVSTS